MKHQAFVYRDWADVAVLGQRDRNEVKEAYERGVRDGSKLVKEHVEGMAGDIRAQMGGLMQKFKEQEVKFFAEADNKIAAAALAIASKVLSREAQVDPLVLQTAVTHAIEQVKQAENIRVTVPGQYLQLWMDALDNTVEVVGDPMMTSGEVRISCEFGTAELGISAQISELEQAMLQPSTVATVSLQ